MATYQSKFTGAQIDEALESISLKATKSDVDATIAALTKRIEDLEALHNPTDATDTYTVTLSVNNEEYGTVSGGGTKHLGDSVEITATPNTGYEFEKWSDDNTENPRTLVISGDVTLTANFKVKEAEASGADETKEAGESESTPSESTDETSETPETTPEETA